MRAEDDAVPEPGKQVLQTIQVPAPSSADQGGENAASPKTEKISYWLFLPSSKSQKKKNGYPLLLFLHGSGERGDPEAVRKYGPPMLVETEQGERWPFITVSPVCPPGKRWSTEQLLFLLDYIESAYPVDWRRVYVTGLSMGGYGTWELLDKAGDRFAAAAPLCGGSSPDKAERMLNYPIWIFHGEADPNVPVTKSIEMEEAIKKLGGRKVKLTLYPDCGHNCWTETYANPELYKWLLSHKLRKSQQK